MSKIIVLEGCRDCPFKHCDSIEWNLWVCTHGGFQLLDGMKDGFDTELPETPHPDCKLKDLPTEEDVTLQAIQYSEKEWHPHFNTHDFEEGFLRGANYVLNKIK